MLEIESSEDSPATADIGMRVSVVVPSYNRLAALRDTLAGLAEQTLDSTAFEVIIIDNVSSDGTFTAVTAMAPELPFKLRVERMPGENRGPAPARNFGVSLACGEIVAFTDSDCRPHPDWLARGLAVFDDQSVGFATGVVDFKPDQISSIGFFTRLTVVTDHEHPTYPTANAFYRKAVFESFGGFSETLSFPSIFGIAVEAADTDLAWRIKEAGHSNVFVPAAIVHHEVQNVKPRDWILEPLRLFLIPALVKQHPGLRSALLAHNLFFYSGSIVYYVLLTMTLLVLIVKPVLLFALPIALIGVAAFKSRSLHPGKVLIRSGRVLLNAGRVYVMSFALLYGSVRFGALVL